MSLPENSGRGQDRLNRVFRPFEAKEWLYQTKMVGKPDQPSWSVGNQPIFGQETRPLRYGEAILLELSPEPFPTPYALFPDFHAR